VDFTGITASPAIDDQEEEKKPAEEETVREERDKPPTHTGEEGRRSRRLSQELAGAARWGFLRHSGYVQISIINGQGMYRPALCLSTP